MLLEEGGQLDWRLISPGIFRKPRLLAQSLIIYKTIFSPFIVFWIWRYYFVWAQPYMFIFMFLLTERSFLATEAFLKPNDPFPHILIQLVPSHVTVTPAAWLYIAMSSRPFNQYCFVFSVLILPRSPIGLDWLKQLTREVDELDEENEGVEDPRRVQHVAPGA